MASVASFETVTPTKPTLADYGDNQKENSTKFPPKPQDPNADEWNKMALMLEALGRVAPVAILTFTNPSSVFTPATVLTWNRALTTADFATTLSRSAAGRYTFTPAANKLPPFTVAHAQLNNTATSVTGGVDVSVSGSTVAIRTTRNSVDTDVPFTLFIY